MSKSTATRARPLSPHLQVYRLTPTMLMSGIHRATGFALYFGVLLFAIWVCAAANSKEHFDTLNSLLGSLLGRLVLFGFTWALVHHMVSGIRHMIGDMGRGLEKDFARRMAIATLVISIALTVLLWVVGYAVRGGF